MNSLNKTLKKLVKREEMSPVIGERLGFHLMPPVGWLNDPNGLCWANGTYHVFFQYAPFDAQGGLKFWGHYDSADLLHWRYTGVALSPDQPFDCHGAYSGSAWCTEDKIHLFYTGNVKYEGAYDYIREGRGADTIHAYFDPVSGEAYGKTQLLRREDYPQGLTCHVRDPKVFQEDSGYRMILGARRLDDVGEVLLYTSKDLTHWQFDKAITTEEPFGYMWECPDLFMLEGHQILSVSPQGVPAQAARFQNPYQCGYFQLEGDTPQAFQEWDYGTDFYAPQTFLDGQGRHILIGWMGMPDAPYTNPTVADGWQHALTTARVLTFENGRVRQTPVQELEQLRGQEIPYHTATQTAPRQMEWLLDNPTGESLQVQIGGVQCTYQKAMQKVTVSYLDAQTASGRTAREAPVTQLTNMRILVDTTSIEFFLNGGETVFTTRFYPQGETLQIHAEGQSLQHRVYPLRSLTIERKDRA